MANNICFKFEVFKFAKEELKRTLIKYYCGQRKNQKNNQAKYVVKESNNAVVQCALLNLTKDKLKFIGMVQIKQDSDNSIR